MESIFDIIQGRVVDKRNERMRFTDEAYEKINATRGKYPELSKKRIAQIINYVCPAGKDDFVIDYRKQCNEAKVYGKAFHGIYNKLKKENGTSRI